MENRVIEDEVERFDHLLQELNISAFTLSKELGYKNNNSVQRIKKGEAKLSSETFTNKLLKRYPFISLHYLQTGELPALLTPEQQLIQQTLLNIKETPYYDPLLISSIDNKVNLLVQENILLRKEISEIKALLNQIYLQTKKSI